MTRKYKLNARHKEFRRLLDECGMTQPGASNVLGLDRDKVARMYYGRDCVLPEALEAMRIIKEAVNYCQANVLGVTERTTCATCGTDLPEGGYVNDALGLHYPAACSPACARAQ